MLGNRKIIRLIKDWVLICGLLVVTMNTSSSTNKQIHGFAYFDKHYVVLMLKRICLETGILFYAYRW